MSSRSLLVAYVESLTNHYWMLLYTMISKVIYSLNCSFYWLTSLNVQMSTGIFLFWSFWMISFIQVKGNRGPTNDCLRTSALMQNFACGYMPTEIWRRQEYFHMVMIIFSLLRCYYFFFLGILLVLTIIY